MKTQMLKRLPAYTCIIIALLSPKCIASPPPSSTTNVGGWHVALTAPTNFFPAGAEIKVTLCVSNATKIKGELGWSWQPDTCPGFGKLEILKVDSRTKLQYVGPKYRMLDDRGGSVSPGDGMAFDFLLSAHYGLREPGNYEIRFRGKLPSILEPESKMEFETAPLVFGVGEKTGGTSELPKATNAPLVATMKFARTNYHIGEPVLVTLTVSNRSEVSITLPESYSFALEFPVAKATVERADKSPVARLKPSYLRGDHNVSVRISDLAPHSQKSWESDLTRRFALTNAGNYTATTVVFYPSRESTNGSASLEPITANFVISPP
jgi:hypothetical protein